MKRSRVFTEQAYWLGRADEDVLFRTELDYSLKRSVRQRMQRALITTYKPVIDDVPFRVFSTMHAYTAWCETHLPKWLGYEKAA